MPNTVLTGYAEDTLFTEGYDFDSSDHKVSRFREGWVRKLGILDKEPTLQTLIVDIAGAAQGATSIPIKDPAIDDILYRGDVIAAYTPGTPNTPLLLTKATADVILTNGVTTAIPCLPLSAALSENDEIKTRLLRPIVGLTGGASPTTNKDMFEARTRNSGLIVAQAAGAVRETVEFTGNIVGSGQARGETLFRYVDAGLRGIEATKRTGQRLFLQCRQALFYDGGVGFGCEEGVIHITSFNVPSEGADAFETFTASANVDGFLSPYIPDGFSAADLVTVLDP